jgi:hypothetical protein
MFDKILIYIFVCVQTSPEECLIQFLMKFIRTTRKLFIKNDGKYKVVHNLKHIFIEKFRKQHIKTKS